MDTQAITYFVKQHADDLLCDLADLCEHPSPNEASKFLARIREFKQAGLMQYLKNHQLFYDMLDNVEEFVIENIVSDTKN